MTSRPRDNITPRGWRLIPVRADGQRTGVSRNVVTLSRGGRLEAREREVRAWRLPWTRRRCARGVERGRRRPGCNKRPRTSRRANMSELNPRLIARLDLCVANRTAEFAGTGEWDSIREINIRECRGCCQGGLWIRWADLRWGRGRASNDRWKKRVSAKFNHW